VSLVHTNEGLVLAYLLADCDQLFFIDPLADGVRDIEFTSEGVQRREQIGGPLPNLTLTSLFCSRKEKNLVICRLSSDNQ
jgi:hypothetical protein